MTPARSSWARRCSRAPATSEDDAREVLLGETLFARALEEAPEHERVTWAPRGRILRAHEEAAERAADGGGEARIPPGASTLRTVLSRGAHRTAGCLGLAAGGRVLFAPGPEEPATVVLTREKVEVARIAGFPSRRLVVCLLDGSLLEFRAGFIVTNPVARLAVVQLMGSGR